MKIAIVIERYLPGGGGNERSTEQIARALAARGHDVTLLASRGPADPDAVPGVRIETPAGAPSTGSAPGLWWFARWVRRQLDRGGYDVSLSVSMSIPADVVQPRGGTVRQTLRRNVDRRPTPARRRLKSLALALNPKQRALLALERRTVRDPRVKRLVAISRYVADQLRGHYGVPAERITLIPNAASVERHDAATGARLRRVVRRRWSIDDAAVLFLFAAMNPGLKGLDSALEALGRVRRHDRRAVLIVAGSMRLSLRRRVRAMGLADAVRIVGQTGQIDALYAAADATVLPTWYDPASKVVIESLLHGVPAISTTSNGASQWILDPAAGRINPADPAPGDPRVEERPQPAGRVIASPRDIDQLAEAMLAMCDPDERARCAQAATQVSDVLGMDRHVDALEQVLTEVAAASRSTDA